MANPGGMPFEIEGDCVRIELREEFDAEALAQTMQRIVEHPDFSPGRDVICDVREGVVNPSLEEIKSMLSVLHAVGSRFSGCWAIVVSDPLRYGLARMASSLASPLGMKMAAFHTLEEAQAWLKKLRSEGRNPHQ